MRKLLLGIVVFLSFSTLSQDECGDYLELRICPLIAGEIKTVDIPHSNEKGEIWFQECVCGKQQEVMFNHNGEYVRIKSKQR